MPPSQQQPGQSDDSNAILWMVTALFAAVGVIWYNYKAFIVGLFLKFKLLEIGFISLFTSSLDDVRITILSYDPAHTTLTQIMQVGQAVGDYLRIPFVILIFALAFLVYLTNSTRIFKHTYSMRELVGLEKGNWPQITPVAHLDLIKTDIDKGPWAMAMTPMQFCKRHQLLEESKRPFQEGMTRKEWGKVTVSLRRGQANKIFSVQLGPLWQGVNKLPPHTKALFAVFAARINADAEAAASLLAKIGASSETKLDFTGADELCKKYESTKLVKKITETHAYMLTVMASMLRSARDDGVQASSDFLWLKPVDRRLWYMLNTVGRQTPFVEVAGIFAHWQAETDIGRKLLVPMVEEATNALQLALEEIIYHPDEEKDEEKTEG